LAVALGLLNPARKEWANSRTLSQVFTTHTPGTGWVEKGIALSWMGILLHIHAQKRFHYLGHVDSAIPLQFFLRKKQIDKPPKKKHNCNQTKSLKNYL